MITQEYLRERFDYNPETGIMTFKKDYRRNKAGTQAGYLTDRGYLRVKLKGKHYRLHRIIWMWVHGTFPVNEIDHINRNRMDNRLSNLRDVTRKVNANNTCRSKNMVPKASLADPMDVKGVP